jgi:hypothetical protein
MPWQCDGDGLSVIRQTGAERRMRSPAIVMSDPFGQHVAQSRSSSGITQSR